MGLHLGDTAADHRVAGQYDMINPGAGDTSTVG
jgi:hypothetical protein